MSEESRLQQVQAQILRQHVEIRARMRGIERMAVSVGSPDTRRHLRMSLAHFASVFDEHLAFEERELAPLLRAIDAWGPVREEALLSEHREQRARVVRTVTLAEEGELHGLELTGEIHWLMRTILIDMVEEEKELATLELIEANAIPQMTG